MADDVPLALDMCVGLPAGPPLTELRDVDNYMQPVVAELGDARSDAVFGSNGTRTTRRWPCAVRPCRT